MAIQKNQGSRALAISIFAVAIAFPGAIGQHTKGPVLLKAGMGVPNQQTSSSLAGGNLPLPAFTVARAAIQQKYAELGGERGFLGKPAGDLGSCPDGVGYFIHYQGGSIYWTAATGAHEVHGAIREEWKALGWERSVLGYPLTDENVAPDRNGRYNHFQNGSIYWSPRTCAHEIHGLIRDKWASMGWEKSYLGYPVTDVTPVLNTKDRHVVRSWFQGGNIELTSPGGAVDHRSDFDAVSNCKDPRNRSETWRIDRPEVRHERTDYPWIRFHPGDTITINAGGCVQTGGRGKTWKSYVKPLGDNAGSRYSGMIWIPGVTGGGLQRIKGVIETRTPLTVPSHLPKDVQPRLFLHMGYQDDQWDDNGYYDHDDGNFDQCKNVGAAWVEIKVTSRPPGAPPSTAGPVYSPHSKDFDLVWDINEGVDNNGLPLNPMWAYQIDHHNQKPDFGITCGPAFSDGDKINVGTLAAVCTSQAPTTDLSQSWLKSFGYCPGNPLRGHLNWGISTHAGTISWTDFSGTTLPLQDDEYNFTLYPDHNAGLTVANSGLQLEFSAWEAIDLFSAPWWVDFHHAVDAGDQVAGAKVNGHQAVVTGLFGIDAVHNGGMSESHPLFSMAINTFASQGPDGIDDQWAFFLKNFGNEGGCSHLEHHWESDNGVYYLQLPRPPYASDVSLVPGSAQVWAASWDRAGATNLGDITLEKDSKWTYIPIHLSDFSTVVNGQFTLHYSVPQGVKSVSLRGLKAATKTRAVRLTGAAPRRVHSDDDGWGNVEKRIADPAARQRFIEAVRAMPAPPARKAVSTRLNVNPTIGMHRPSIGKARHGILVRSRAIEDPVQQKQRADREQAILKLLPPSAQQPRKVRLPRKLSPDKAKPK